MDETGGGIAVSHETMDALRRYLGELEKWQRSINLVGPDTMPDAWRRHVVDSLQLVPHLDGRVQIADLGSGGGFPGMVLAIVLRERPQARVTLIESNAKKAAFLRHVAIKTGAPAMVLQERVDQALPKIPPPQVITARALAPLVTLIGWCEGLLKSGTLGLFHKGRDLQQELADASRSWGLAYEIIPSLVAADSSVVKLTGLTDLGRLKELSQ